MLVQIHQRALYVYVIRIFLMNGFVYGFQILHLTTRQYKYRLHTVSRITNQMLSLTKASGGPVQFRGANINIHIRP